MRSVNNRDRIDWHRFNYDPEPTDWRIASAFVCIILASAILIVGAMVLP